MEMGTGGDTTKRSNYFRTPNDKKSMRRWGTSDEVGPIVFDPVYKYDSPPIKAVRCEDALGKPCNSFSFDEHFRLDSDLSDGAIDDNWSPVAMGEAKVTLENRVSPLKSYYMNGRQDSQLLGGLHPVAQKSSPLKLRKREGEEEDRGSFETVQVNLRIQFLKNAQDFLLNYREKLMKANKVMKQLDMNTNRF